MAVPIQKDPYLWLEDLSAKKTISWARNRDRIFRTKLKPKFQNLHEDIARFFKVTNILEVKVTNRGTFFLERNPDSYTIRLDRKILLDSRSLGEDYVIFRLYTDERGDRLAYFASKGEDDGVLRIINVDTGKKLGELKGDIADVAFTSDGFYYVKNFTNRPAPDGTKPPASRIMKGSRIVFGKGVPTGQFLLIRESSGQALVTISQWSKSQIYSGDIEDPSTWKKQHGGKHLSTPVEYVEGKGLLIATYDGKGDGRILLNDKPLIEEQGEVLVDAILVGDEIICNYLKNCASHLKVYDLSGVLKSDFSPRYKCSFDFMSSNAHKAIVVGSSFGIPSAVYEYSHGKFKLLETNEIVKMKVSDGYANSKDGTKVHYFQLGESSKKVLIWGYGGFSLARTPVYDPMFCALVERGITCVLCNLRGGNEFGERWHILGKREKKQNVFDDYAAVLKKFKQDGARVVAFGRSNGGLLVGAVLTQHPELMDGALIGYPVLDMMRFHRMLIGSAWIDEYGNPDEKSDRKYLLKYSPYHNVKKIQYPSTMIYTSLHDDRVHPAHAFKFAARLEENGSEVWLRVQLKGGHGGASTRIKIDELADEAGFVAYALDN